MKRKTKHITLILLMLLTINLLPSQSLISVAAQTENYTFLVNGIYINKDSAAHTGNCWTYANALYKLLWGVNFTNKFYSNVAYESNMLSNLDGESRRLNATNTKNFINAAALGSVIRITWTESTTITDSDAPANNPSNPGHNLILVEKRADGFFCLEDWSNYSLTSFYTWDQFVASGARLGYTHFKYIKYPNAPNYASNVDQSTPTSVPVVAPVVAISSAEIVEGNPITFSWGSVAGAQYYDYFITEYPEGYAYTDPYKKERISNNYVTFTDLPAGKYTLFVHSVASDGTQSPQSNWVSINVMPRSYQDVNFGVFNGKLYIVYDNEVSWSFARDLAIKLGGQLASITSSEENSFVANLINGGSRDAYWLGGTNIDSITGSYTWLSGEVFGFSDWYPGEPNATGTNGKKEAFIEIRKSYGYKWNDASNTNKISKGFVVEAPYIFNVILNPNMGTVSTPILEYNNKSDYGILPIPTREGFTFKGWYNDAGNLISDFTKFTNYQIHQLTAQWEEIKKSNVIKFQINNPYLTLNENQFLIDSNQTKPIIRNNRTLMPVKAVIEAMGGSVIWYPETKTVELVHPNGQLFLKLNSNIAWDSTSYYPLEASPVAINGRTFLPIKFIVEYFGGLVEYDQYTKTVTITY